jgi:alpha-tubulin suppressor-like RCC1 family protein
MNPHVWLTVVSLFFFAAYPAYASVHAPTPAETAIREALPRLSGGDRHSCYVPNDGVVRCWGSNDKGQLGDGTTTSRLVPDFAKTLFPFGFRLTLVVATTAGNDHNCALRAFGTVLCWGSNEVGQLGDGTLTQRTRAVQVSGISNAVRISAGAFHTCALLADGTMRCWGSNNKGQLGDGTTSNRVTPVQVTGLTNVTDIAAGGEHTCAVRANLSAQRCWGSNSNGQLGDGTNIDSLTPVENLGSTAAIVAGPAHTCALRLNGAVFCWGSNNRGQIGDGTTVDRLTPTFVPGLTNATALTAGGSHTCALFGDGTGACWGANSDGQIGDGSTTDRLQPAGLSSLAKAVTIHAGINHTCAVVASGEAFCWGDNASGQLGNGTLSDSILPNPVTGISGSVNAKQVIGGFFHACAVRSNGTASCWGRNSGGELGDGSTTDRPTPVPVSGITNALAIAGGSPGHTCAILGDGTGRCWGLNNTGQLGDNTNTQRLTAVPVSGLSNAVSISATGPTSCALLADGTARCWGNNSNGQIGDGTTTSKRVPTAVSLGSLAAAIATGGSHTCALIDGGSVQCWGNNSSGQLGDGTTNQHLTPVAVTGLTNAVAIAVGTSHTCALLVDGSARCWGSNTNGRLGDGTTTNRLTPVAVTGLSNAIGITAGPDHTCALISDGTAQCWGFNGDGRLGAGLLTTPNRLTPTPVADLTTAVAINAYSTNTCALRVDGAVFCWGDNTFGQIGDGTTSDSSTPVAVPSFTLNISPTVRLQANPREAIVDIIAVCEEGDRLQVRVDLIQGSVSGQGSGQAVCGGALASFPVRVRAGGNGLFGVGAARAEADAKIHDQGAPVRQEWIREVQIVTE